MRTKSIEQSTREGDAAFTLVSVAVPVLRGRRADIERPFKVPGNPVLPIVSAAICFYLMLTLPVETWWRFILWTALGFAIYFLYGYRCSRLSGHPMADEAPSMTST